MITKCSDLADRTREIGTLRALGFRRGSIMTALLAESSALALLSWGAGPGLASLMPFFTNSRANWQSFSELAFSLALTPAIVVRPLVFAPARGWWAPCCPPSARCA